MTFKRVSERESDEKFRLTKNGGKRELARLWSLLKALVPKALKLIPPAWYRWKARNFYFVSSIGYL